jgi:hypothetical protein
MTLMPAFEIGVWNAWIPMLYFPLHPLIMMLIHRLIGVGDLNKKMGSATYSATEGRIFTSAMVLTLLGLLYSIFLPLKLGTIWFDTGLPVYLV